MRNSLAIEQNAPSDYELLDSYSEALYQSDSYYSPSEEEATVGTSYDGANANTHSSSVFDRLQMEMHY